MRRHLNISMRVRSIHHKLSKTMYSQCNYLLCNSIHVNTSSIQNVQLYLDCHIDRLDKDGLFDRREGANVYHY